MKIELRCNKSARALREKTLKLVCSSTLHIVLLTKKCLTCPYCELYFLSPREKARVWFPNQKEVRNYGVVTPKQNVATGSFHPPHNSLVGKPEENYVMDPY